MKEEILDIAKKLYHNHLTPETATKLLLDLFAVSGRSEQLVCVCKNRQDQFKRGDAWICGDCEEEIKQTNCH